MKAAFKVLVKRLHPDVNDGDRGAEERLRFVFVAHKILTDKTLGAAMDMHGADLFKRILDEVTMFWDGWMRVGMQAATMPAVIATAQTTCFLNMCVASQQMVLGAIFPHLELGSREATPPPRTAETAPTGKRAPLQLVHSRAA